jgi:hypothetical protein
MKETAHDNKYPVNPAGPQLHRRIHPVKNRKMQNKANLNKYLISGGTCKEVLSLSEELPCGWTLQNKPKFPHFQSKIKGCPKIKPKKMRKAKSAAGEQSQILLWHRRPRLWSFSSSRRDIQTFALSLLPFTFRQNKANFLPQSV